ncbi:MAG: hypothetical protein EAZ16_02180 [Sphingobacteriales bacterium]|nr:MAG: hypothetical protein EAZ16_02180 [Sphingobacteriales bacterium]
MKPVKYIGLVLLLITVLLSCQKKINDDLSFVNNAASPEELSVLFEITQDNTGVVTITPNGNGVAQYDVYYGHGGNTPVLVLPGKNTTHVYPEGVYTVKIVARSVTGKVTEVTKPLTVSFKAPENLAATVTIDPVNNFKVNVTASALYETNFRVFFGDIPNEPGLVFLEGQTPSHTYAAVGNYTVKVIAYSGGAATTTYTTTITITDPILLPISFESLTVNYTFTDFGGGVATKINNPHMNGINTSAKVGKLVKNAPEVWGGSFITLGNPIDFSSNKVFRMKVYSPRVGAKVLLKTENLTNGGISFEKEVITTVANTWEDLAFDFRTINTANSYQKIVLIFDLGISGDGSANFTWLFDDIRLVNQMPVSLLSLPVSFDQAGINYEVVDFGNNLTADASDPVNASNKVKKTTKPGGAEVWAGTTIGAGFTSPIPFTATKTQMSVRVYSPTAGLRIRLKVEDRTNNTRSVETEAMTQAVNTWETLIFDFANQSSGTAPINLSYTYNMASIFFDFGNAGTGKVFYWDDITFLPVNTTPNYLALPLDFQSTTYSYPFVDFGGGNATVVNNPSASGINTSSKVAKMVKNTGEVYGGSFIELVNSINFASSRTFKVKVFSPRIGAKVLLKVENASNGGINFEKEVTTTTANAWEELTFDFNAINIGNSYQKIVLIFDLGTMGDGSSNYTYYFDDIRLN